jgi:hypothetical protein
MAGVIMDIAATTTTTTTATGDAYSDEEAKMLLQCGKQIADLALLGKKADKGEKANNIMRMIEEKKDDINTTKDGDWLHEEMKSIQWPDNNNNPNSRLLWKQAANSFFATTSSIHSEENDLLQSCINHQSKSIEPFLISIRRLLHRYPELMYQERITSQIVQRVLTEMGITNFSVGWAKNIHSKYYNNPVATDDNDDDGGGHGIVVDIGSGQEPCVLLRADMDALPIIEQTPPPPDIRGASTTTAEGETKFRSNFHGKMHACGHVSLFFFICVLRNGMSIMQTCLSKSKSPFPPPYLY